MGDLNFLAAMSLGNALSWCFQKITHCFQPKRGTMATVFQAYISCVQASIMSWWLNLLSWGRWSFQPGPLLWTTQQICCSSTVELPAQQETMYIYIVSTPRYRLTSQI